MTKTTQETDSQTVLDAILSGKPLDSEVRRRVKERSRQIQQQLLQKFGVQEVVVDALQESRDEQ